MRNFNDFLQGLKLQFEESDAELLRPDTVFSNLDTFDSLTRYSILAYIEDDFSVKLPNDIFKNVSTPEDLFKLISNE